MNTSINFEFKSFDELTTLQLYYITQARIQVFVVEQNCAYQDLDDADLFVIHVMLKIDDKLAGYCRILPPATNTANQTSLSTNKPAIGRVLITSTYRRQGLARQLMTQAISYCHTHFPNQDIRISAQTYLLKFYQSLGFVSQGEPHLEDNIEHIDMIFPYSADYAK